MAQARLERFRQRVEPELPALYRSAYRLTGNRADAEDLVQETCLTAWEKTPPAAGDKPLEHWLLRVLYHRFVDGDRRRKRGPIRRVNGAEDPTPNLASPAPGPAELAAWHDTESQLDLAWQELEPMQQVILALRAEGYGLAEIAEITGIGHDVLRARLHRARQSLARALQNTKDTGAAAGKRRKQP